MTKKNTSFEKSLDEIAQLVKKMEQGNLALEEALQCFEGGVKQIRDCQQALNKAEQTVKILTQDNQLTPFDNDSNNND